MTHLLVRCECGAKLQLKISTAGKLRRCPGAAPASAPGAAESLNGTRRPEPAPATPGQIRETIEAAFLAANLDEPSALAAQALAAHPWPDTPVPDHVLTAITAELLPAGNLDHHDIREIATDRLLRIAESLRHESQHELAATYSRAADELQSLPTDSCRRSIAPGRTRPPAADLLLDPPGLGIPLAAPVAAPDIADPAEPGLTASFAHLFGLAAASGTSDIGLIQGDEPTGVSLEQLARQLKIPPPVEAFDRHIRQLDSRERDIVVSRLFVLRSPDTLEELAARWKLSRERIRQLGTRLESEIEQRFSGILCRLGQPALRPYRNVIVPIRGLQLAARRAATASQWRDTVAAAILQFLGPWHQRDGWAFTESIRNRVENLKTVLEAETDDYGVLTDAAVDEALRGLVRDENERDEYATEVIGLGHICGQWTLRDSNRCRIVAALRFLGRPATKEEIAELTELSVSGVGSTFGAIDAIVRADKERWGFAEWIDDEYDGIVGEINQRIDANGGTVPVSLLIREIPERFGVSESSVRAYLGSDAFTTEDGFVRRAGDDRYVARPPQSCSGAVAIDEKWGQQLRLYDRHFRGYSLGVSFDIAFANGVRPGDDLLVPVNNSEHEASVIWRPHSLNRMIDVGRVSDFLESAGYVEGDEVIVVPGSRSVELLSPEDAFQETSHKKSEATKDTDAGSTDSPNGTDDVHDPLLDLLGG